MSNATLSKSLADVSSRVQEQASEAFHDGRIATADALESTAARVKAGGDRVSDVANATASSLGASAKYVRRNDGREMMGDVETLIRRHPGKALLGAAILGFVAGRAFRRD
ncbi:MAG: hypothetical protein HY059_06110 [Proteobacteria bacterium]|nr:hypothetical protein [Pseudomonadota bacterium]